VVLAQFGELHPDAAKAADLTGAVVAFEVFLDALPAEKKKATKAKPALALNDLLPVKRDFAFIVDQAVAAADVMKAAAGADKALIGAVDVFDVYAGQGIPEGKKSIAVEVTIQPAQSTLTDAEIEALSKKIAADVAKATKAELRG
jgi:phenylalanyl-tRNA synthetase beta chain